MELANNYLNTRLKSLDICAPLEVEDYVVQPFEHVSPPKWHLAHTTWFFERFILEGRPDYSVFDDKFNFLFNSYYKTVGEHWQRGARGALSRPGVNKIKDYRARVDEEMVRIIKQGLSKEERELLEIGVHHEQQHQELLLMDIKSILSLDPGLAPYRSEAPNSVSTAPKESWKRLEEGCYEFGAKGRGFAYDNERPAHRRHIRASEVSERLVTNKEFLEFILDDGYSRPELWMSKGWEWVQNERTEAPLYWRRQGEKITEYTLYGETELTPEWPVQHISYFEADAFARWRKARLPSEFELELAFDADEQNTSSEKYHGTDSSSKGNELWAWTNDQYTAYPGYQSYNGSLGEYNRKFMCNQFVLRGGCFATPKGHHRKTYRNFYEPDQRWMFSGLRLARDLN